MRLKKFSNIIVYSVWHTHAYCIFYTSTGICKKKKCIQMEFKNKRWHKYVFRRRFTSRKESVLRVFRKKKKKEPAVPPCTYIIIWRHVLHYLVTELLCYIIRTIYDVSVVRNSAQFGFDVNNLFNSSQLAHIV